MPEASEACSRWLSAATPPDLHAKKSFLHPGGVPELLVVPSSGVVVARAPQAPATGCDATGIVE